MKISSYFKRFCFVLALLMFPACGGGGGGGGGSSATPEPAPNISLATSIDFGASRLNNLSGQTFEITNTGNLDLTIGNISNPSPQEFRHFK